MKYIYLTFFFLLVIWSAKAEQGFKFQRYSVEDGLVHDYVNCIYEDSNGFLWIATRGGVSKFDGIKFENYVYSENTPGSIGLGWVTDIVEDTKGRLWFGIAGAEQFLMLYKNGEFIDVGKNLDLDGATPKTGIAADSRGNIWLLENSTEGVFRYNHDTGETTIFSKHKSTPEKLRFAGIFSVFEDNEGFIWIGTNRGLFRYDQDDDTFKHWSHDNNDPSSLCSDRIETIFQDRNNTIWVGSFGRGLDKYIPPKSDSDGPGHFIHFKHNPDDPHSICSNAIYSMYEDPLNRFWIGTLKGGALMNRQTNSFQSFYYSEYNNQSINSNTIRYIIYDFSGNLWFGTRLGLARLLNQKFMTYTYSSQSNSLSNDKIVYVSLYKNDQLIVSSTQTIDLYDLKNKTFKKLLEINNEEKLLVGPPLVTETDEHGFWIGTWSKGLQYYDFIAKTSKFYFPDPEKENGISATRIFALFDDGKGLLWIGSHTQGINVFDKQTQECTYLMPEKGNENSLSSNSVWQVKRDTKKRIWVSGDKGINLLIDPVQYKFKRFFTSYNVEHIFEDSNSLLWLSTTKGLLCFNPDDESSVLYTMKDGLPSNIIRSALEDDNNNLWVGTTKGFVKLKPDRNVADKTKPYKIRVYKKSDGLQLEYLPRSCTKLSDGTLFFGGTKGLSVFHPDSVKDNKTLPKLAFTGLQIHDKNVGVGDTINGQVILTQQLLNTKDIVLNHKNNAFVIKFAALHYNNPEDNLYAYKLQGYNDKWVTTTALQRQASFMNLPDGDYTFLMKAANSDGVWNNVPISMHIIVLPPWWQTWWFRVIVLLSLSILIISIYRYRIKALKRQQRILERKVAERTTELQEANSQLEEKQEEILQQNEEIITVNNQLRTKNEEIEAQKEEIQSSRDQLEKAFNNITLLSEFGQKITATFDFDTINKMIYNYVKSLMDTAAFGIGIYNDARKIIDFPYFMENGEPVPYFFKTLSNDKSLSVRCFKNSEEIFINNLSEEYQKYLQELPDVQIEKLPASVIHLPLMIENKPIGIITVNSFKKSAYNENDIANLRTLASYISIALDNSKAYRIIRSKNEQISGSIRYGQTIQQAMLPPSEQINKYFDNFILYRPKDIVSGDFYWFASIKNPLNPQGLDSDNSINPVKNPEGLVSDKLENPLGFNNGFYFLAVVDCTGHGVPGAFMSMIGSRLLNDIVIERKIYSPAKILEQLNIMVRKALRQDTTDNHDGMDVCLCRFQENDTGWELTFAGAKRPLLHYNSSSKSIETLEGTRKSIGGFMADKNEITFEETSLKVNKDDEFFLSTDGFVDQCNPQKRKFTQKRLVDLLGQISQKPVDEQKNNVENELDSFQKGFEQRDDITLMGVRIK